MLTILHLTSPSLHHSSPEHTKISTLFLHESPWQHVQITVFCFPVIVAQTRELFVKNLIIKCFAQKWSGISSSIICVKSFLT